MKITNNKTQHHRNGKHQWKQNGNASPDFADNPIQKQCHWYERLVWKAEHLGNFQTTIGPL